MSFIAEALRAAFERRVHALAYATLCCIALSTFGVLFWRSDREARTFREELDSGVSTVVTLRAGGDVPVLPDWLSASLRANPNVSAVVAVGGAVDVFALGTGRGPVPFRLVEGDFSAVGVRDCGSYPSGIASRSVVDGLGADGGLLVTPDPLGRSSSVLSITASERGYAFQAELGSAVLSNCAWPPSDASTIQLIHVDVPNRSNVPAVEEFARALLIPLGRGPSVSSDSDVVLFRERLAEEAAANRSRNIRAAILSLFLSTSLFGALVGVIRRQDFGRRRALGASRGGLAVSVVVEVSAVCVASATAAALAIGAVQFGSSAWTDLDWLPAAMWLSISLVVAGQAPALVIAQFADPVKTLRKP